MNQTPDWIVKLRTDILERMRKLDDEIFERAILLHFQAPFALNGIGYYGC